MRNTGPPVGKLPDARSRRSWHDRGRSGVCWLRPDLFGDAELHSAAECFITQMRICDLRVRIVRDGHEPNETEEQRPCCVPIEPVHVISSPKGRREQERYQNSGSFDENGWGDFASANPRSFAHAAIVAKHGHARPDRMAVTAGRLQSPPTPVLRDAAVDYCTTSPCSARSRPSRSMSCVTRRPTNILTTARMIKLTTAS
jgi:hypothetical protein